MNDVRPIAAMVGEVAEIYIVGPVQRIAAPAKTGMQGCWQAIASRENQERVYQIWKHSELRG